MKSIRLARIASFACYLHMLVISIDDWLGSRHSWSSVTFTCSLSQSMQWDLIQNGARGRIGGDGHIVEVDESKFGKRKYNSGRRVVGKWVLGGVSRTTGECFLVECPDNRRNHHTLLSLIKRYINPGTTILSDRWKGYTHTWIAMDISTSPWIIDVDSSTLQRACIQIPVKVCGTTLSVTREGGTDEPGLIQLQWTWHSVNLCGWRDLILHVLMFLFVRVLTLRFLSSWKEPLVE